MLLLISLLTSYILIFHTPQIPEGLKNSINDDSDFDLNYGFPYQYFERETLTSEQSIYRIRYIVLLILVASSSLIPNPAPANPIGLPASTNRSSIERVVNSQKSVSRNFSIVRSQPKTFKVKYEEFFQKNKIKMYKISCKYLGKQSRFKSKDFREKLAQDIIQQKQHTKNRVVNYSDFINEYSPIYSYTLTNKFLNGNKEVLTKIKIDLLYPGIRVTRVKEEQISQPKKSISSEAKRLNIQKPLKQRTQTLLKLPKLETKSEGEIISRTFIPPKQNKKELKRDYAIRVHEAVLQQADGRTIWLLKTGFYIDEIERLNNVLDLEL